MTANQADYVLALPAAEVGRAVLAVPEDQWFDRKSARIAPRDLGPPIAAFANAEGGVIVVGLHDGTVEGCGQHQDKVNAFRQAAIDFTVPPTWVGFSEVPCVNSRREEDIRIDPGERVHELQNGDCYLRVGDESRKLNYHQRQELEFDKGQSQYDGFPCPGVAMTDLDDRLLDDYRSSTGAAKATATRNQALRQESPLREPGRAIGITARIARRQVHGGLISEYRTVA